MNTLTRMMRAAFGYAILIEGWGDATAQVASDKRFWLCSAPLRNDPDSLCIDVLDDYPSQIGSDVSLAERTLSGDALTFGLFSDTGVLEAVRAVLCTVHVRAAARITADLSPTDTAITLDTIGLDNGLIYIGREAIYLQDADPPASATYNCLRGRLGTQPQGHQVQGDRDVYVSPPIWEGRKVDLISYSTRGTYDDAEVLWTGLLTKRAGRAEGIKISCQSALQIIEQARICKRLWKGVVSRPSDLTNEFSGAGRPYAGTSEAPQVLLVFGDRLAATVSYSYLEEGDITRGTYTAFGELTSDLNEDSRYNLGDVEPGSEVREMFSTNSRAPAIRSTYTGTSQRLSQNPIRFLQQILTTTEVGGNGDWDLGVGDLGVGLPQTALHLEQWDAFATRYSSPEYRLVDLDLAFDGEPVEVMSLVHRVLGPLHLALCPTRRGIGVMGWEDQIPIEGAVGVITQAGHVGADNNPSETDFNGISAVDQVEVRWGQSYGRKGLQLDLTDETRRNRYPYGEAGDLSIDASGFSRQFALTAGSRISQAYRTPAPIATFRAGRDVLDVDCGALIDYSHPFLQADGVLGASNLPVQVIGRKLNLGAHGDHETVDYTVALTGLGLANSGRIANAAKVQSFVAGTLAQVIVERSWFKDEGSQPLHPDSSPWAAGDRIDLRASDLSIKHADNENREINSVLPNTPTGYDTITIKTDSVLLSGGVVAGDVVRHSREDQVESAQRARFAWMANASGALTSGRDAYTYGLETAARPGSASNVVGWTALDDGAAEDDGVLDEALLQILASNIRTLANGLLSSSSVFLDAQRPIRLHGNPHRFCVPIVWRKAEAVTEITVTILCTGHDADTELRCALLDVGGGVRKSTEAQTIAAGFEGEVQFVIAGLQPEARTLTIALSASSSTDAGGSVSLSRDRVVGPFPFEPNDRRWIQTEDSAVAVGSGNVSLDPEKVWILHEGSDPLEEDVPFSRRLWLHTTSGAFGKHEHWVWPTLSEAESDLYAGRHTLGTHQDLYWTPIGHVRVYSIQVQDSDSDASVPDLTQYRAGLSTSARSLGELASALEWTWRNRTTVLGVGGAVERTPFLPLSPNATAVLPMGALRRYARSGNTVFQTDDEAWTTVWAASVPLAPKEVDLAGNIRYLSTIRCAGLVGVWMRDTPPEDVDVWLRLSVYDEAGLGRVEGTIQKLTIPADEVVFEAQPLSDGGWLRMATFAGPESAVAPPVNPIADLSAHDGRGLYPYLDTSNLTKIGLVPFELAVDDTEADQPTERRVQIEYMFAAEAPDLGYESAPRVFFPAACAWIQRGVRGE